MPTTNISAKDVMSLRQRTGLGMMDCKAALSETDGDIEAAEQLLRERMKGKMDTRTDRPAGEGCVAVAIEGGQAAIVELRAETDFTARNELFRTTAQEIADYMAKEQPGAITSADEEITSKVDHVRITTGENASFARGESLKGGAFGKYVHHDGKLAVLLQVEGDVEQDTLTGVCQHIAAHVPTPAAIDQGDMPRDLVDAHQKEAVREAEESGKPREIAEKIAQGKMRKFFEENTLLGQKYVRDEKKSIREVLPDGVKVMRFIRYAVGG